VDNLCNRMIVGVSATPQESLLSTEYYLRHKIFPRRVTESRSADRSRYSSGNVHCKDLEINAVAPTSDKNLKCKAASEAFDKKKKKTKHRYRYTGADRDTNTDREKYLLLLVALQPQ